MLKQFLASPQRPGDTMTYHELQGFLFAIACAPELIKPPEWMPLIFNEQEACYESMEEAQSVIQALMDLYNVINTQIFTGEVALPPFSVIRISCGLQITKYQSLITGSHVLRTLACILV